MTTELRDAVPSYSINRIIALRDRLIEVMVTKYADITLDAEDTDAVAADLIRLLPKTIPSSVITSTAHLLNRQNLTERDWKLMCWRLAGNVANMRNGLILTPWTAPGIKEWAPMQVLRVDPAAVRNGDHRFNLKFRILAGTACGLVINKIFSSSWLSYLSGLVGFTNSYGKRPYASVYQFSGMRIYGLLDPTMCRQDQPGFHKVKVQSSCITHNTKLINMRNKLTFKCPQNYTHECHQCSIGMTSCPAATHLKNYVHAYCLQCNKRGWVDPEISNTTCISCWRKQASAPQN